MSGTPKAAAEAYRAAVQAFGEIAGALNDAVDQQDLLRLIARHVCELTGIERCSIYLREERTDLFRGQVGYGRVDEREQGEADARIQRLVCGTEADRFTREIVATRRPVVVADTTTDPRPVRSAMRSWGVRSMLGVPLVTRGDVVGIAFLDDGDRAHRFTDDQVELASGFADMAAVVIAQAQLAGASRESLRTVARQNDLLRRAAAMDDRLTALLLDGADLHEIAHAACRLAGKPVDIYDQHGRRLARGVPEGMRPADVPAVLDPRMRSLPAVREALAALGDRGSGVLGPFPEAGVHHRFVVAPITTRDDTWGAVVVLEQGAAFGALDRHLARRAAVNAALELSAERRAARAEWDARASLAGRLIRGSGDAAALRRRAEFLGLDLEVPHVVCLLAVRDDTVDPLPDLAVLTAGLDRRDAGLSLASHVSEGILLVLSSDAQLPRRAAVAAIEGRLRETVAELSPDVPLRIALSTAVVGVDAFPDAYGEAAQILGTMRELVEADRTVTLAADDLGAGRLLVGSASRRQADRFVDDVLGPLLDPDDPGLVDLRRTLEVFLAEQRSVRRAARALDVHENTVRYRLARIDELCGMPVSADSDAQLTAQTALLLLRVRRLGSELSPSTALSGDTGPAPEPGA